MKNCKLEDCHKKMPIWTILTQKIANLENFVANLALIVTKNCQFRHDFAKKCKFGLHHHKKSPKNVNLDYIVAKNCQFGHNCC